MPTDDAPTTVVKAASAGLNQARESFDSSREEAADAVRDIRDNFGDAIETSLEERPYATLLMALGVGFALGALWRR